jgi:AbrB family looped-hinge helix DNA binding protein
VVFRVKLGKTGKSLRITVPKPVTEGFQWGEGDEIELVVTEHEILLRRADRAAGQREAG